MRSVCLSIVLLCNGLCFARQGMEPIPRKDSLLLQEFWNAFKKAIDKKDKAGLTKLFSFPFYCAQCADLTPANDPYGATVKVNRLLFDTSIYRLFYNIPASNDYNKKLWSMKGLPFFPAYDDKNRKTGYQLSYAIIPPSEKWEGSQGFITVRKINGRYLADGLYTVP